MGRVEDKVALVTGGALGIGRACSLMLAREGASVVVSDINEQEGSNVVKEIEEARGKAIFVNHDVSKEDQWQNAIARTLEAFGKLDIVVNNAGIAQTNNVEEDTLDKWRFLLSINLDGVFLGTKYGIEAMKKSGGGSIVNMSSILGIVGEPTAASYNASKGGVRLLTKSAALHCAKAGYNIRVNSVHPGYIVTPMIQGGLDDPQSGEAMRKHLVALHPLGHLGESDDVAYGVLYLASDESKFVTGSELVIDGGYTAQ